MRIAQELIDAIVSHLELGDDLITAYYLFQASLSVFSRQICLNLHDDIVCLSTDNSGYTTLAAIFRLCPTIYQHVYQLQIERSPTSELHPEEYALPAVLDACTGLRALHIHSVHHNDSWKTRFPDAHRRAIYRAIQRPSLETLGLQGFSFQPNAILELGALNIPPELKTIRLAACSLRSANSFMTQLSFADGAEGGAPSVRNFVCDQYSLQFARLLFRKQRRYPFGELRALDFTFMTAGDHDRDHERLRQLLRANQHLEDLTLRTAPSLLPIRDIYEAAALRSLTLDYTPRLPGCDPRRIADILNSIRTQSEHTLEEFRLVGVTKVQGVTASSIPDVWHPLNATARSVPDEWPYIDAALCRFPALKRVGVVKPGRPPVTKDLTSAMQVKEHAEAAIRASMGKRLPSTQARGILDITNLRLLSSSYNLVFHVRFERRGVNPQLEHFVLRIEHWPFPARCDLSGNKALSTLTINFTRWRESREASIDDALSRFEGLKVVSVRLTRPANKERRAVAEEWEKPIAEPLVPRVTHWRSKFRCTMRLPQELVDAITSNLQLGDDLITAYYLLQASPLIFSPQISLNLHHDLVHLSAGSSRYTTLSAVFRLCPSICSHVYQLQIERSPTSELHPEEYALPALLDACVSLRSVHIYSVHLSDSWDTRFPDAHRRAIYRAIQRPSLETLGLQGFSFGPSAIIELGALHMPPELKTIRLAECSLRSGNYFMAQASTAAGAEGAAPSVRELACDQYSLQFARLLFRAPRRYPFGDLRTLKLTFMTGGDHDSDHERLRQLLRANPRLEDLTLRTAPSLLPIRDISGAVTLRSLKIDYTPRLSGCNPRCIADVLNSISPSSVPTLEQFHLVGVTNAQGVLAGAVRDVWPQIDAALCRFPALKMVGVAVQVTKHEEAVLRLSTANLLPSTRARGILDLTFDYFTLDRR
ncbi:uncharacterized protein SCHCODRAFT_02550569 [Schizophyllum commune H4-8]|uniref:F-box domain-containing protein n=1 Tax=Schizophyllum commune (strain H4-8 / FGSC 9210) TaxID=578458 RepID=D8QES7_SCHCM|nr:uncharacterized protein SCHCODRAFT_02550569 [Schizophyllum commune H4-8]KAI5888161.1 hypothetical protein SCHCODRAFT_02550569 [Schizophyllum commune H4-8]